MYSTANYSYNRGKQVLEDMFHYASAVGCICYDEDDNGNVFSL